MVGFMGVFFHDWLQGDKRTWRVCPAALFFLTFCNTKVHEGDTKFHEDFQFNFYGI